MTLASVGQKLGPELSWETKFKFGSSEDVLPNGWPEPMVSTIERGRISGLWYSQLIPSGGVFDRINQSIEMSLENSSTRAELFHWQERTRP